MQLQNPATPVVAADIDTGIDFVGIDIDFEIDPDSDFDIDIDFDSYRYS